MNLTKNILFMIFLSTPASANWENFKFDDGGVINVLAYSKPTQVKMSDGNKFTSQIVFRCANNGTDNMVLFSGFKHGTLEDFDTADGYFYVDKRRMKFRYSFTTLSLSPGQDETYIRALSLDWKHLAQEYKLLLKANSISITIPLNNESIATAKYDLKGSTAAINKALYACKYYSAGVLKRSEMKKPSV